MDNLQMRESTYANKSHSTYRNGTPAWNTNTSDGDFLSYKDILKEFNGNDANNAKQQQQQNKNLTHQQTSSIPQRSVSDMLNALSFMSSKNNAWIQAEPTVMSQIRTQDMPPNVVKGDLNSDGNIDADDLDLLEKYTVEKLYPSKPGSDSAEKLARANNINLASIDTDGDGDVSEADIKATDREIRSYLKLENRNIDRNDAIKAMSHIVGTDKLKDSKIIQRLDLDDNGKVDIADLKKMANKVGDPTIKDLVDELEEGLKISVDDGNHLIPLGAGESSQPVKGDANGDGVVDNTDIVALKMHIVGLNKITDAETINRVDFDGDGKISVNDLTRLDDVVNKPEEIMPTPPNPTPEPSPKVDNEKTAISYSNEDLTRVRRHLVKLDPITDPEMIAKYDFGGDGEISIFDLTCADRLVSEDTNGDGVFDQTDAEALRGNPDKADILAIWDNKFSDYNKQIELKKEQEFNEMDEERKNIQDDIKNVFVVDDDTEEEITSKDEETKEELPVLKFDTVDGSVPGDITGNGKVDDDDIKLIADYIKGLLFFGNSERFIDGAYKFMDIDTDMLQKMDINRDDVIDETDYSIAINLANGIEMKGLPGSSRDNPKYMVGSYISDSHQGEYVIYDERYYWPGDGVEDKVYYIGYGDTVSYGGVHMSDYPHTIVVPPYTSVYANGNSLTENKHNGYYNTNEGSLEITIDDDKKITIKPLDTSYFEIVANDTFINAKVNSHVKTTGKNTTVSINHSEDSIDSPGHTQIDLAGEDDIIIRNTGSDTDTFHIGAKAKNCEIQNNDDSAFTIEFSELINLIEIKNNNGVPTIYYRKDHSSGITIPLVALKGIINPETQIKYKAHDSYDSNWTIKKISKLPGAQYIFKEELPNAQYIFKKSENNNPPIITKLTDPLWITRSYTQVVPEPSKEFTEEVDDINSTLTVSGGNEVRISETNDKLQEVVPNLITYNGEVDVKAGDLFLKVDDKEYIESKGAATFTRDGDKLKVKAKEALDLETLEESNNVEINALIGDNSITLNGTNGKVITGDGNDKIKIGGSKNIVYTGGGNDKIEISGKGSAVYLSDGDNSVTINAESFVQNGNGNNTFFARSPGGIINEFDTKKDTLNFSTSLGSLVAESKKVGDRNSIIIKNADTGKHVLALVNCTDLGKVNEILEQHNHSVKLEELEQEIDAAKKDLADNISSLIGDQMRFFEIQGIDEMKKIVENVSSSEKIPENILFDFAQAVAEDLTQKGGFSADVLKSPNSLAAFIKRMLSQKWTVNGKNYNMEISGLGTNSTYFYSADVTWKDLLGKTHNATIALPSNTEENQKAMLNFMGVLKDFGTEIMTDATKTVISELTGVGKNKVSAIYDLGEAYVDAMSGKEVNKDKVWSALKGLSGEAILGIGKYFIQRAGEIDWKKSDEFKKVTQRTSFNERTYTKNFEAAVENIKKAEALCKELASVKSRSNYNDLEKILGDMKKAINGLS